MKLKKKMTEFFRDESGQTNIEYILILAVVVMIAMKMKDQLNRVVGSAGQQLEQNVTNTLGGMQ